MKFTNPKGTVFYKPKAREVIPRPTVYGITFDDGKVLLVYDKIHKVFSLPGGAVESSESLDEALNREFLEETGIGVARFIKKIGQLENNFYEDKLDIFYKASLHYFLVELDSFSGKIQSTEEIEYTKWVDIETLEDIDTSPRNVLMIRRATKEL
ncbi:MAG: NUDIX hydrolase [bacterium]|nr:NUDIX hydrolase [bacterium]